jgi:coenzyme F420-reducing hydrogenase alpha subunit
MFLARLAEVETAVNSLAAAAPFPLAAAGSDGWGVAQTLTARGVLTHAAHVVDGKVASYRVQAPTDSYFADASALSSLLGNLEFASLDHARQALNQAILALDPCLPYEVELHDA